MINRYDLNGDTRTGITLFWFRRDLRLDDNAGLYAALQSKYPVLPVFIFDSHILGQLQARSDRRITFICQALQNISSKLMDLKSTLLVLEGDPLHQLQQVVEKYPVREVYCNHDYEPYATERDNSVAQWLKTRQIPFYTCKDQVIFERSEVMKEDGSPYTVFTPYSVKWKQKLSGKDTQPFPVEDLSHRFFHCSPIPVPAPENIGFITTDSCTVVPEVNENIICDYHLTRNTPSVEGTSKLSVHLRFGTVSIRELVKTALRLNQEWLNELIWREFFMMILFHFPHVVKSSFKKKYDFIPWRNDEREFNRWCAGETGYPIVDAGMRELSETGFMHNRVRMIVASFLTKHLLIDWRWGEAWFAEKLLDYELSSNNGNWQWAAGSGCDAAPYFRIFNPWEQTRRYDPELLYVRKWVKDAGSSRYPDPIVEHTFARERALTAYKTVLQN